MEQHYDLVVIGGGPAGYAGAIRAGQLGKRVACIETERAGGTCLNWGCIPSKALLKSAELYQSLQHSEAFGFTCEKVNVDFGAVMKRSRLVADRMAKGIEFLFKKNNVDYLRGTAHITAPGQVGIKGGSDHGTRCTADNILIATGCKARQLPDIPVDGERVLTSREALVMKALPKSVGIVGAGAIGVEFAYFLNAFGCEVTLIEMLPKILPVEDTEASAALTRAFKKQGITSHVNTRVEAIKVKEASVNMELVKDGKVTPLEVESLLLAIGVVPNTEGLLGPTVKLAQERGYIQVDACYATSAKGIYAAGDVIGPPWLAHVATFEAVQAVNGMFGHAPPQRVTVFPACTYCQPQVASIGLTEQMAQEKGIAYKVGKFPFTASGKAVAVDHAEGFVKVVASEEHGEILGAHIIGADATELIGEYGIAMKLEATVEEIHQTIHAHPTLSEALGEAAAAVDGAAIHIPN